MEILQKSIKIDTKEKLVFVDITEDLSKLVSSSKIKNGFAIVTTKHTTTALCINEKCERLQDDMRSLLSKLAPEQADYKHNLSTVDNRPNAHAHLLSLLLKTSEVIPFGDGKLLLGDWQRFFFIELDGPRSNRTINVMLAGETK